MSEAISIDFEGERIEAQAGESLAAALAGRGILALRSTRCGAERGIFCGMGICHDCLVEVDGRPNQRACMTVIDRPLTVRREAHARPLPSTNGSAVSAPVSLERPDVLVIGGGPGGLAAAIAASEAGASVTLIDERSKAGGQYFKQLGVSAAPGPDRQHREGLALVETARRVGVDLRTGVLVWGAFHSEGFAAVAGERALRFQPKAAIVATGAYERPWPIPGWTLPGVMTTGAAQTLWRTARRLPGCRVLIAGNGPLNLQLAGELIEGGADVVAVVEAAARPGFTHLGALVSMFAAAPGLVRDGVRYHARRRAGGAKMLYGQVATSIALNGSGLTVDLATAESMKKNGRRFEVDVVCLGYGFEPANELLRLLGCGHDYDAERRHLITRRHEGGRTDVAGVYALGDCTGLGGARVALAEGTIVGLAAAADIGHPETAALKARRRKAEMALRQHRRFQRALWRLYQAPAYSAALATPETLICRCEEVSFGEIEAALAEEMRSAGAIKRRTRLGMGRCQARYCGPVLEALLESRCGQTRGEFSGFAPRVPVKPLPIGLLTQAFAPSTE
jgi:NADPH-dependent 2,4-dienoyl-CoA reductase/sulfur reductase-like enzyme